MTCLLQHIKPLKYKQKLDILLKQTKMTKEQSGLKYNSLTENSTHSGPHVQGKSQVLTAFLKVCRVRPTIH